MPSGDSEYVCTLDAASIKKAKDELNEIPEDRLAAVQALREWCESQPHINANTKTEYLLRYLRGAKFSQLKARTMIEGTLKMKNTYSGMLDDVDPLDPKIQKILDQGSFMPLPGRDKEGRKIIIQRIGASDPSDKSIQFKDMIRAWVVLGIYMGRDEITQVNGSTFFSDMTGATIKHFTRFDRSEMGKWHKAWQGSIPGRYKAFHHYNCGALIDTLMTIVKPIMPKKWMDRLKFHDNLESVYKHIPKDLLPEEYLPDEYTGPNAGLVDNIVAEMKKELCSEDFRRFVLEETSSKYKLDESKRPQDSGEPVALFRKLNVD